MYFVSKGLSAQGCKKQFRFVSVERSEIVAAGRGVAPAGVRMVRSRAGEQSLRSLRVSFLFREVADKAC
jgi:hypothetical protein